MKLKIKLAEQIGFKKLATKAVEMIDQFATPDDIAHRVGLEDASKLPSVNPANIEGGYTYSMKGSSRMQEQQVKRQDTKDLFQLMAGYPTVRQDWLADYTLEQFGIDEEQRRKAILPDQNALQLEMLKAQMSSGKAESTRLISDGSVAGGLSPNPSGRDQNEKLSLNI